MRTALHLASNDDGAAPLSEDANPDGLIAVIALLLPQADEIELLLIQIANTLPKSKRPLSMYDDTSAPTVHSFGSPARESVLLVTLHEEGRPLCAAAVKVARHVAVSSTESANTPAVSAFLIISHLQIQNR